MRVGDLLSVLSPTITLHVVDTKTDQDYGFYHMASDARTVENQIVAYICREDDQSGAHITLVYVE